MLRHQCAITTLVLQMKSCVINHISLMMLLLLQALVSATLLLCCLLPIHLSLHFLEHVAHLVVHRHVLANTPVHTAHLSHMQVHIFCLVDALFEATFLQPGGGEPWRWQRCQWLVASIAAPPHMNDVYTLLT